MGKLVPSELEPESDRSERVVAEALKELPEGWVAYHSVGWTQKHGQSLRQGEADFVLLNRDFGILTVEVKGGQVEVKNGDWFSRPFGSRDVVKIKDPLEQANRNKWAIKSLLQNLTKINNLPVGQLAVFPSGELSGELGLSVDPNLIVTKKDLSNSIALEDRIKRAIEYQGIKPKFNASEWEKIEDCLAPQFSIRSFLKDEIRYAEKELEEKTSNMLNLTLEQIKVLTALWSKPRVGVVGAAGTGKTILALEQAKRLFNVGCKVLFISGRGQLLRVIERELRSSGVPEVELESPTPGVLVTTPHKFLNQLRKSVGAKNGLVFSTGDATANWLVNGDIYSKQFEEVVNNLGFRFDAIIIDEAQDLSPQVIDTLTEVLEDRSESPIWFFFDPKQSMLASDWKPNFPAEYLLLTANCRNTIEIQRSYSGVSGSDSSEVTGVHGPETIYREVLNMNEAELATIEILRSLQKSGIDKRDVVILSWGKGRNASKREIYRSVAGYQGVAGYNVRFKTPDITKGQEFSVAILLLHAQQYDSAWNRKFYVAASRAISQLFVIGEPDSIAAAKSLANPASQ
jgi:hypothetical protein